MQDSSSHCVESRGAARTNLFLAATLNSADVGHPVKIRDLSATGARIETLHVPEVGAAVTLVRGRLSVTAKVSWHAGRFCGLSFDSPVSIQAWMTNPVILERRRGKRLAEGDVPGAAPAQPDAVNVGRVGEELARISRLLRTLGDTLASDSGVVFKHGTELFNLGRAARTLAALAETMGGDTPEAAESTSRRDNRRS